MDNRTPSRTLLVTVPDDDSAERVVRYVAKALRDEQELIVLDYDPVIPKEATPAIVAQLVTFLKMQEARFRVLEQEALESRINS